MGDEFLISLNESESSLLRKLEHEICSVGCYTRENSGSEGAIAFGWSDKDRRPDWPEDFTITQRGNQLILTVHSANGREIEKILLDVQFALRRVGNPAITVDEI